MILAIDFSFLYGLHAFCFYLGLFLGLAAWFSAWGRLRELKSEFAKYKKQASTHLELASEQYATNKEDAEKLRQEAENLRSRVVELKAHPGGKLQGELEIYKLAEQQMIKIAPGFAQAWQSARENAEAELAQIDAGRSLPKRLLSFFQRPRRDEPQEALPAPKPDEPARDADAAN